MTWQKRPIKVEHVQLKVSSLSKSIMWSSDNFIDVFYSYMYRAPRHYVHRLLFYDVGFKEKKKKNALKH